MGNAYSLLADLHTHTISSGHAYSTLQENLVVAAAQGLKMLAVTDHGPAVDGAPNKYYFMNEDIWPQQQEGIWLLRGVEANILPGGVLDLPDSVLEKLDFVLAGFHYDGYAPHGDAKQYTEDLLRVMENPFVHAISHPGNPAYPIDNEAFVHQAVEKDILIEINNSSLGSEMRPGSWENCRKIVSLGKAVGAKFIISSDAHYCSLIGKTDAACRLAAEVGISEERIVNSHPMKVATFLQQKGKRLSPELFVEDCDEPYRPSTDSALSVL